MKNNLARYIALFDLHCGYEFNDESDYDKSIPKFMESHDPSLLRKIHKFAKDFQPDYLILGGDQINLSVISRWVNNKPRMVEGRTIKEDFEIFAKYIDPIQSLDSIKEWAWIEGNHEERLKEYILKHPELVGLADYNTILSKWATKEIGLKVIPSGRLYKPGNAKVSFTHGHIALGSGGDAQNHGKKLVNSYHRSVRAGHLHTFSAWTERVAVDAQDYHTGIVVPPCCRPNLPYAKNKPASNQQGFLIGEFDTVSGNFWDYVVVVVNGEFVINGKRY